LFENSPLMKGQDKFNPNENTFRDFNWSRFWKLDTIFVPIIKSEDVV
jgi:hypothetical protein